MSKHIGRHLPIRRNNIVGKLAIFLADGFEEIEGLTVVDICRRCGLTIDTISINATTDVMSSHKIPVRADKVFSEIDPEDYEMLILPGGGLGTKNLEAFEPLMQALDRFHAAGKSIAAICAAPSIFGHRGYLNGRNATCYPGFEDQLTGADAKGTPVEISDHIITGRGMGTSIDFALAIAARFAGQAKADEVAHGITYR